MTQDASVLQQEFNAAVVLTEARLQELDNARDAARPSMRLRPQLSIDGNQWCALFGQSLQDGVAGFGESPDAAYKDFDRAWMESLKDRGAK